MDILEVVVNQSMFNNQMLISKVDINFHPKLPFYDKMCTFTSFIKEYCYVESRKCYS